MKIDQSVVNTLNKRNVISTIRDRGPVSRPEIAKVVSLSVPTVMRLTAGLIEQGLVREVGERKSSGGKPPRLLEFNLNAYYLIGVDIGTNKIKTIVMNMGADIINRIETPTIISDPPIKVINRIIETIAAVISDTKFPLSSFLGIGLGMPGLLDVKNGTVLFSPDFNWENVDLLGAIKNRFCLPICMTNVTRAMAMAEKWFGLARHVNDFMCINLGYGIGSALFINDELYGGYSDGSGEFGHITLERNGPLCSCGNYGCLESLASANAMTRRALSLISRGEQTIITKLVNGNLSKVEAKVIFDAAKLDDRLAKDIVRDAIEYIGIAIASAVHLVDPELIILEGGITKAGDILTNGIKRVVGRRLMKHAGNKLRISTSELGEDAAAIGASAYLLSELVSRGGSIEQIGI